MKKLLPPQKPYVEYVLTADFDVDIGPTVKFQYPAPIQGDERLMAELMLPDQIHARTEDWTVFFLYKQKESQVLEYHIPDDQVKEAATKYYVLNLVNTKFDNAVKRGATVKAMCLVCTVSFFQIFKPLLLLALDDYFKTPSDDSLHNVYAAANSLDMTAMPMFSPVEKQLLRSQDDTNLFADKFESFLEEAKPGSRANATDADKQSRPGSGSGKDALLPPIPGEEQYYIDLKNRQKVAKTLIRDTHFYDAKVDYKNLKIPIRVPTDQFDESVGDFSVIKLISTLLAINSPFQNLHPHLTIYGSNTPPLLVLIFALLTQKRILFIGLNTPSRDVAEHVLACCSVASAGILRSFTTNAFPYTDLSKVDELLSAPGYIAGVKNPAFEHHPTWWDVIIDLENFTMKISPDIAQQSQQSNRSSNASSPSFVHPEDQQFVDDVKHMVNNHYGERSVRARCRQYISRFIRLATNYEDMKYGLTNLWPSPNDPTYSVIPGYGYVWASEQQKSHDLQLYAVVVEGWRASRNYKHYIDDQRDVWPTPPKSVVDFEYILDRLRLQQLTYEESGNLLELLCTHCSDYDDINQLLTIPTLNNLFFIALGLFHRDHAIRTMTVLLLQRIESHEAGRAFFQHLSEFQKMAYRRLIREAQVNKPFVPQNGVPF